jgi:hypothetical protein
LALFTNAEVTDVVIFQPCLHSVSSPSALNTSLNDWYHTILTPTRNGRDAKALLSNRSAWVDVRDLADTHRLALEKSEASGERIIISKGRVVWQDWSMFLSSLHIYPISWCLLSLFAVDAAKKVDPKVLSTLGNPDVLKDSDDDVAANAEKIHQVDYNTSKAKEIFGINYRTEKDSVTDIISEFSKRGW